MNSAKNTVLITGASTGIGESFARHYAGEGWNLILVARSADKLEGVAANLRERHGVAVRVLPADLSRTSEVARLAKETEGERVHLLINNAGFSTVGEFDQISPERDRELVMLNVMAVLDLCHVFIPRIIRDGGGGVINVASIVSFIALGQQAAYAASKAFVLSLSESLWVAYRNRGVHVLAVCPGATATPFFAVMGKDFALPKMSADDVVRIACRAYARRRHYVVAGLRNYFECVLMPRLLPRSIAARIVEAVTRDAYK